MERALRENMGEGEKSGGGRGQGEGILEKEEEG